jgi:hypothetical protein
MKGFVYDAKEGTLLGELDAAGAHTAGTFKQFLFVFMFGSNIFRFFFLVVGIYGASWSPDSKQIFTASADKTCKLWDAETRKLVRTFKVSDSPQTEDQQLGCLWQGTELVSVSLSGNIKYMFFFFFFFFFGFVPSAFQYDFIYCLLSF